MSNDVRSRPESLGDRLRIFRQAVDCKSDYAFAKQIGVTPQSLNAAINGDFLSNKMADLIRKRYPQAPIEWIRWGETRLLTFDLADLLNEARIKLSVGSRKR